MRIEGPKNSSGLGKARKGSASSGQGFSLPGETTSSDAPSPATGASVSGVSSLDAILALQSVDGNEDRERRAVQHGHDLLDQLEALRADLLAGHISPQRVGSLLSLIRAKQSAEDPNLSSLIGDIALRARVELAKLGVDP
jgi:hypothetical protein